MWLPALDIDVFGSAASSVPNSSFLLRHSTGGVGYGSVALSLPCMRETWFPVSAGAVLLLWAFGGVTIRWVFSPALVPVFIPFKEIKQCMIVTMVFVSKVAYFLFFEEPFLVCWWQSFIETRRNG